jgi:hypothetical protein
MGVQTHASQRNEQAEVLVDFLLRSVASQLREEGILSRFVEPSRQKPFRRDDCSDVFDNYLEIELTRPSKDVEGTVQLWVQSTCYKGNARGTPEPNKSYEIRETLIESLGLRRWLADERVCFRTIHFTLGPPAYAYGWIKLAKDNAFDLSLYPDPALGDFDLFNALGVLFRHARPELQMREALSAEIRKGTSALGRMVLTMSRQLHDWLAGGLRTCPMADKQAEMLSILRRQQIAAAAEAIAASRRGGADIKPRFERAVIAGQSEDPIMLRTVARVLDRNPFLATALTAESDWSRWSNSTFGIPPGVGTLAGYVTHLWRLPPPGRLVSRRLLLRIHSDDSVEYVQDTGIAGLTEHNLYAGDHDRRQIDAIVGRITSALTSSGIHSPHDLLAQLSGTRGRRILRASRQLEIVNGTELKPSFFYIEEALRARYSFLAFSETDLPPPVAYHSAFGATVRPYQNMKVVVDDHKVPVGIIKAKFFREPEFPRRAKEEAYVGVTTNMRYDAGAFRERYPGLPLFMFVDMEASFHPPEYAVRRLATAGWHVVFSIDELEQRLQGR